MSIIQFDNLNRNSEERETQIDHSSIQIWLGL